MSSRQSSSTSASTGVKEFVYEVLYYERKNKVHKSKGISKFDGTLFISLPAGSIRLKDASAEEEEDGDGANSDDDSQTLRGKAKQKQWRKSRKQPCKPIPYSGTDKVLALRCCDGERDLQDGDVIALGSYEVQIVSCLSNQKFMTKPASRLVVPRSTNGSLLRKRANPLSSSNGHLSRSVVSKPLQSSKPKMVSNNICQSLTNTETKISTRPVPHPLQQKKRPLLHSPKTTAPFIRRSVPLLSRSKEGSSQEKRARKAPRLSLVAKSNKENDDSASSKLCPSIPMPASLRTALRPHQIEGVEFLWEALTKGDKKGAILADEMVSL